MKSIIFITLIATVLCDKPQNAYLPPANSRDVGTSYLRGSSTFSGVTTRPEAYSTTPSGYYSDQGFGSSTLPPVYGTPIQNKPQVAPIAPVYGAPFGNTQHGAGGFTTRPVYGPPLHNKPQGSDGYTLNQGNNKNPSSPVYGAPFQNKPHGHAPNQISPVYGGPESPLYGAPLQGSNSYTPRPSPPVYGAPFQNKPVYSVSGSSSYAPRSISTAYGAPLQGSNSYTPRPTYGAPFQNKHQESNTQRPIYGAPFQNKPYPIDGAPGSGSYTQRPVTSLYGAPPQASNGYTPQSSSPVNGTPFQNRPQGSNGYTQRPSTAFQGSNSYIQSPSSPVYGAPFQTKPQGFTPRPTSPVYGAPYQNKFGQSAESQSSILRSNNDNDGSGYYKFDFQTENQISRQEVGEVKNLGPEGTASVQGSYSYVGPDGHNYIVNYIADENGFQPQGDHISTAIQRTSASKDVEGKYAGASRQYLPPNKSGYTY